MLGANIEEYFIQWGYSNTTQYAVAYYAVQRTASRCRLAWMAAQGVLSPGTFLGFRRRDPLQKRTPMAQKFVQRQTPEQLQLPGARAGVTGPKAGWSATQRTSLALRKMASQHTEISVIYSNHKPVEAQASCLWGRILSHSPFSRTQFSNLVAAEVSRSGGKFVF